MPEKFEQLKDDDVISTESSMPVMSHPVFKVETYLKDALKRSIGGQEEQQQQWLEGVECEMLSLGSQWQKGKVRVKLSLEFCPEVDDVAPARS